MNDFGQRGRLDGGPFYRGAAGGRPYLAGRRAWV